MQHELIKLRNNLNTLFIDSPGSTAGSVQVWFRAGSALESKENQGIAHFLEHMFFKGTSKRPGSAIAHEVEGFGGELNAFTSFDYTCYYINTPNNYLDTTVEILLDMVSNPLFNNEDLIPERDVVLEEYKRSQDNPNQYAFQKIQNGFFTKGYKHPILGTPKNITSFNQKQISDFRDKFYSLNNCLLVVAGDLKKKKTIKSTIESFTLPKGENTKFPPFKLKTLPSIDIHHKDTHLAQINICIQAPTFDSDYASREDLAISCLGHGESSYLHQELVTNSQQAISCGSSTMFMNDGGFHYMKINFLPENLNNVLKELERIFKSLIYNGISDDDVLKIKNQYVASKIYDMESIESFAFSLGHGFASSGDVNSEEEFTNRIKNTTVSEVNRSLLDILQRPIHISLQLPKEKSSKQAEKQIKLFQERINKSFSQKKTTSKDNEKLNLKVTSSEFDSQVKLYQVKPGVKLIYRQNKMNPTFILHSYIKGGITEETIETNGLYQLISSTITKGYKGKSYTELKTELDFLSASLSSFSGKNAYGLTLHGQTENFNVLCDHFIGTLLHPTFKASHVKQEKDQSQAALLNYEKDPVKRCFKQVGEVFFKNHPYSMSVIGNTKSLKKISAKQIKETHSSNLNQKELLFTYCGDLPFEKVLEKLSPLLDQLPKRKSQKLKVKRIQKLKEKKFHLPMDREQTQIFIGTPTAPMASSDNIILKMITTYLSGQSSELFVDVRDRKGLCYTAQPIHFPALEAGYWGIYMASSTDKVEPAIKAINNIIQKIKHKGIKKSDFNRIKKMISGQNLLNIQTNEDFANIYSVTSLQGMELDQFHLNNQAIKNLSYENFNSKIREIFSQDWSTILVGK